jgi:hypothetical protein
MLTAGTTPLIHSKYSKKAISALVMPVLQSNARLVNLEMGISQRARKVVF